MKIDIVLSGVGGQGIITMGIVIGDACTKLGVNIKIAETHGMAQRGGSVEVFVRIGDIEAPLIPIASADYVVALEMIEALRAIRYLKKCGWMILSDLYLPPPGVENIPTKKQIIDVLSKSPINILTIDTQDIINEIGDARTINMIMLGALLAFQEISSIIPIEIVEDVVEHILGKTNRFALTAGYRQALEKLNRKNYISNCISL
ncbi:MAG: indolepyruvate oxidoreductase subunit beta [Ignisphaera sp.]